VSHFKLCVANAGYYVQHDVIQKNQLHNASLAARKGLSH